MLSTQKYTFEDTVTLPIYDPFDLDENGNPKDTGAKVTYLNPALPKAKKRLLEEYKRIEDDTESNATQRDVKLAAYCVGWSGISEDGKTPLEYSREAARAVLANPNNSWFADPHFNAITGQAVFLANASKS